MMRDPHALQLFIWILTHANEKGEVSFSRYAVGRELRVNSNTLYSALRRLVQKYKCLTQSSTTSHTTITLLNWDKYQSKESHVNNDATTLQPRDNTINKNKNNTYIQLTSGQKEKLKKEFPLLQVDLELEKFTAWQKANNKTFPNTFERFRLWLLDLKERPRTARTTTAKVNPIVADPMFKRLLGVYKPVTDGDMRIKMALESQLGSKYPMFKHELDWAEAKKQLASLQN